MIATNQTTASDAVDGSSTGTAMCQISATDFEPLMSVHVQVSRTPYRCAGVARCVCRCPRSAKARNRGGGARRVQVILWGIGAAGTGARDRRAAGTDGDDAVAAVMTAQRGVASVGSAVSAPEWCGGPVDGARLIRSAAACRIGHGVQEALRLGHELSMASGMGRYCGAPPGPNASTMTRRPPQQGHGSARTRGPSAVSAASASGAGVGAASSSRMRAMLAARPPLAKSP